MSGEKKSLTVNDKRQRFEQILDEYTNEIGINHIIVSPEIQGVLSMTRDELNGMSSEDCGINSFMLSQYCAFIQKQQNRQNVRLSWANHELKRVLAENADKYGDKYVSYEYKSQCVIRDNSEANALDNIIKHASARKQELEYMSSRISLMSQSLIELQQTKRYAK